MIDPAAYERFVRPETVRSHDVARTLAELYTPHIARHWTQPSTLLAFLRGEPMPTYRDRLMGREQARYRRRAEKWKLAKGEVVR